MFSDVQQDLSEAEEVINNKISDLETGFNNTSVAINNLEIGFSNTNVAMSNLESSLGETNQGQMLSKHYVLMMLGQNKQSVCP